MRSVFFCIDGHTGGSPVRLVAGGAPLLRGRTMAERRADFVSRYDWIRTGLCFEPRGHDMMSGGFLYPPTRPDCDLGILFIETSGCLPMCGHGTIGMLTFGLEHGLIRPRHPGRLRVETPAGLIEATYREERGRVVSVRIRNVASYLAIEGLTVDVAGLGPLTIDVAYGGNFYAIVEPQEHYAGLDAVTAADLVLLSREVRKAVQQNVHPQHPEDPTINGVSHVLWTGAPTNDKAHARNAVFYGERAIDRSPCGTGTSARMAQLHARGKLGVGDSFVHESFIGSCFEGLIEDTAQIGDREGIYPSIAGNAVPTGFNTVWIEERDPFRCGFQVL